MCPSPARGDAPAERPWLRDLRLRAGYPNHRTLTASAIGRLPGEEPTPRPPGYAPPIVDYQTETGESASVEVRAIDLPVLCHAGLVAVEAHLGLILGARAQEPRARAELAARDERTLEAMRARFGGEPPVETRHVVPCSSREPHEADLVSHKGSVLLRLSQAGYPVPDFVILTSEAYLDRSGHLGDHVDRAAASLRCLTGQVLGTGEDPLVLALRCCMPCYSPGVMPTFLNVGVVEGTLPALERRVGRHAAHRMFLNNLKNMYACIDHARAAVVTESIRRDLAPEAVDRLIDRLATEVRKADRRLLEDPLHQALFFATQAYLHYEENLDLVITLGRGARSYPGLILQQMVCTVRDPSAHAGVLYSRHPQTGAGMHLQTAHSIFGEEIMTGTVEPDETSFDDPEAIRTKFPGVYHFAPAVGALEREEEGPVTIEFAVEATRRHQLFALLQLNEAGMSGRGAFVAVVDMHQAGIVSRRRVTELIRPYHVKQIEADTIDAETFETLARFCAGVPILPRAAVSARIYFSADAALRAKRQGEKVCFCKRTFAPTDTPVMREVDAIIGLTSAAIHVVTICQSFGAAALLSLEKDGVTLDPVRGLINSTGQIVQEGDWITISSRRGYLYHGKAMFRPARLMRMIRGEQVELEPHEEAAFAAMAYAYRYYQQLVRAQNYEQISTLNEVIRLVNLELRGEAEEAHKLVQGWFDAHEALYVDEVLKSEMGDHLNQHTAFEMLTIDRKIRFFKRALARCLAEQLSGYAAGAFMLGRFLCLPHPVAFWRAFKPEEIGLLVNEWLLFEKYMQVLHDVGERKILRARKKILGEGLDDLSLHAAGVKALVPIKLADVGLAEVTACLPAWTDPQTRHVLELLGGPYGSFYDYDAPWSVEELAKMCQEAGLPLPDRDAR